MIKWLFSIFEKTYLKIKLYIFTEKYQKLLEFSMKILP